MKEIPLTEIEIHSLAKALPKMSEDQFLALKNDIEANGQLEPITLYRGKCVDGRHRHRALKELGMETIKTITLNSQLGIADVESIVLSKEKRRHQSTTQLAIFAWKIYMSRKEHNQKTSQDKVAKEFGTTRTQTARVTKLYKLAGMDIIDHLMDGGKINIGSSYLPINSDSLFSVINFYTKNSIDVMVESTITKNNLIDEEREIISKKINELESEMSESLLRELSKVLHFKLKKD